MAVIIRHGPAGSYKSSYAVWFELLPALRAGRVVVTNVEGMRTIEEIEKLIGERFPSSARLFRFSSQTIEGRKLWQHWYNWCPLGAYILIDEVQDIFSKSLGFNMDKTLYLGIDHFSDILPQDYVHFYSRIRTAFKPKEEFIDDLGKSIIAPDGSIIMPANFEESFQRHRKYNWDITLCTPNIRAIVTEVKSVSELAIAHRSKDGAGFKRRTRMFEHEPLSTTTKPTKDDIVTTVKIPLAVFLLYASTSTGQITKSGFSTAIFKMPKFWVAVFAIVVSLYLFISGITNEHNTLIGSVSDKEETQTAVTSFDDAASLGSLGVPKNQTVPDLATKARNGLADSDDRLSDSSQSPSFPDHALSSETSWPAWFPFQDATGFYLTAVIQKRSSDNQLQSDITFLVTTDRHEIYVRSAMLRRLGVRAVVYDDCMVMLISSSSSMYVGCPPIDKPQNRQDHVQQFPQQQLAMNQAELAIQNNAPINRIF